MSRSGVPFTPSRPVFRQSPAVLARLAIAGMVLAFLAAVLLHLLRRDLAPTSSFVSEYALGHYSTLLTGGLLALAAGSGALLAGLMQALGRLVRRGTILLCIWIAGVVLCAGFPTDADGAVRTTAGMVHIMAALLALVALNSAIFVYADLFRRHPQWQDLSVPSYGLGIMGLLLLAAFNAGVLETLSFLSSARLREWVGLIERMLFMVLLIWLLLAARRLHAGERRLEFELQINQDEASPESGHHAAERQRAVCIASVDMPPKADGPEIKP